MKGPATWRASLSSSFPFLLFRVDLRLKCLGHWGECVLALLMGALLPGLEVKSSGASIEAMPIPAEPPLSLEQIIPEPGAAARELYMVEVHFNRAVRGVEAGDLLINGQGATNVFEAELGQFLFSFPQPEDGIVTISWKVDHGITEAADTNSVFIGSSWTYQLDSQDPASGLLITEFMTDNRRTVKDEDGDYSDWIEIFNSAPTDAPLLGWALTDTAANLGKWRFPDITLPARSYLLVYASSKNKTNITGRLHTNFKLASEGGFLALIAPDSHIASSFSPYPSQASDTSYGRVEGESQMTGFFAQPTPGAQNAYQGRGFSPEVEFSRAGGTFVQSFMLALATGGSNNLIRYTLDGSIPTNTSAVYKTPLLISNSVQVRARAYQENLLPSPVHSEAYIQLNTNLLSFTSDLPVLVLHALGKGSPTSSRLTFAQADFFEPVQGSTSLTNPPSQRLRAGIQIRGSSTEGITKSSYKMELRDDYDMDQDASLLGLPEESDWVLYAPNQFEPVLIHNPFIHQLSRDMGLYSSRTRFVEVYYNKSTGPLSANNYAGIYVLEEKIKIGPQRVDIDKLQPEDGQAPEVTGGYLMKFDRIDPGDSGFTAAGARAAYVDPKEREIKTTQRRPQQTYLQNYFAAFNKALSSTTWRNPATGYPAYIDVDNWIDFHVLEVLSGNVDTLVLSTYFHKPRDGKIHFGPHWDFDRALGSTDGRDNNPRTWNTGPFFSAPWWNKIFSDNDFWQKWVDRWQELRQDQFSLAYINALIDQLADEVRRAQPREYQKWRITMRGGTYQAEVDRMKNWLSNRIDFIDKQMTQPPRIEGEAGPVTADYHVTLAGPANALVYYTTDGSDPRASQGNISSKAMLYTGPITISTNTRLTVRARDLNKRQSGGPPSASSTPWSRPVAQTFVVRPIPLVICEIMFHPSLPDGILATNASNFEYIELLNRGEQPMNLSGFRITGGVEFAFPAISLPAGQRLLVVKNRAAFLSRYPGRSDIAGEFSGELRNSSNRLAVFGSLQEPVLDFTYHDDWARLADGLGYSLVLANERHPGNLYNLREQWRSSALAGGSPGEPEPPRPGLPRVYINEIVANPAPDQQDSIELFNGEEIPADISGWFLTDDYQRPGKFRFPEGTIIPAKSPWVITKSAFEQGSSGFSLNAQGESIYIFSANPDGQLTGWCHGFTFDAQEPGQSLGRWIAPDGTEHLVPYTTPSLGTINPAPPGRPVVISKVMYEPIRREGIDNTRDEFIELRNLSPSEPALPLYDELHPTNTWKIRGTVEFDFPGNFRFPSNRHVVIVGFDPQRHTNALAAFRARYHLGLEVVLAGPWRGALDNRGGVVRLLKPLPPPTSAAEVPYALVEEVSYGILNPRLTINDSMGHGLARVSNVSSGEGPGQWTGHWIFPGDEDDDADGLPNRWEISQGLDPQDRYGQSGPEGDPDGDGFTNLQEFISGTSPRDSTSHPGLSIEPDLSNRLILRFQSGPSRTCSIYIRDDLVSSPWRLMKSMIAPSEGGPILLNDSQTNSARFYRLEIQ